MQTLLYLEESSGLLVRIFEYLRNICVANLVIFGGKYWIVGKPAMEASLQIAWLGGNYSSPSTIYLKVCISNFGSISYLMNVHCSDIYFSHNSQNIDNLVVFLISTIDDSNLEKMTM